MTIVDCQDTSALSSDTHVHIKKLHRFMPCLIRIVVNTNLLLVKDEREEDSESTTKYNRYQKIKATT
jgi:hypothetical protein